MSAQCRYYDELARQEWQRRQDERAAYYAANPRVLTAEQRADKASRAKTALEMKLAYARTGRRSALADRLMGLTGIPTPALERAYHRASLVLAAAWLRVKELR